MTPLRQRMLEDMQLRGFSARTQECYASAVRQLAEHYHRSPDHLTEEDLRQYFLYLTNEKKVARATATIALCGNRFFFEQTLRREWTTLRFVRPAREHTVNGERRAFALLRPITDATAHDAVREAILEAYDDAERTADDAH